MPEQQNNVIMGLNENEVAARENAGLVNKAEISTDLLRKLFAQIHSHISTLYSS